MRDTRGEPSKDDADEALVSELEQLAAMLLERGKIAARVREPRRPTTEEPKAGGEAW